MNQRARGTRRIAVIGGGITGLAAGYRLTELDESLELCVLESSGSAGGVLQTVRRDGLVIERSADSFITAVPWAIDLCRRIGFDDQLLQANQKFRKAFVVHRGRLCEIPEGFLLMAPSRLWPVMKTPLLTFCAKLRLAWEYFVPARQEEGDESIASFVTRRLGRQTYERIVQPLVGGIYTGDPEMLSAAATMPQFVAMEREYGSLIRGARKGAAKSKADKQSSGARYSMFVAPRDGLASLTDALAARLPQGALRLNSPARCLRRREDDKWEVTIGDTTEVFDAVILTVPAPEAAGLLAPVDADLSTNLASIQHASTSIVSVCYRRDQVAHPLDGFGFVVPAIENRRILAGSFSSVKFAGRAPRDSVLMRVFVGGASQAELADLPDDRLRAIAHEELSELLGIRGEPGHWEISRWAGRMPQYHIGHLELVRSIEQRAATLPNFQLAGNAYHGVGLPHCIHSAEKAAEKISNQPAETSERNGIVA